MGDENKKLEILLQWVKDKEKENGEKADNAYDLNKEMLYSRYNNIWATYGKVKEYIEELLEN